MKGEEVASDKVRIGHSKGRLYSLVASEFDDILVLLLVSSDNHFEGNELMNVCTYIVECLSQTKLVYM